MFLREAWGETGPRLAGFEALRKLQSRTFLTQNRGVKGVEEPLQGPNWLDRAASNHCCSLHS